MTRAEQWLRPRQWTIRGALLFLLGALLLYAAFSHPTEQFCTSHRTGCGMVTGFISTTVVATAGYFLVVIRNLRRALPQYLELARLTPERLLPTAGRIRFDDAVLRPGMAAAATSELARSRTAGAPVLIVGPAGAGKTTFLLELISHLATGRTVPVACSLRGQEPPLRLRAMAHDSFIAAIDPLLRSADHAEKIWRRLWADGQISVVIDGLDELMPDRAFSERDQAIRQALAGARNDGLPVVLASRPEAVPVGAIVSTFELDPLTHADAVVYLEDRIPQYSRPDEAQLGELAELARATPFYLDVIAALARARSLPTEAARSPLEQRVRLLDNWVDLLVAERLLRDVDLDPAQRRAVVDGLGEIAHALTSAAVLESAVKDVAADRTVVDGASRLGLVETYAAKDRTGVRFTHAISQSYFLSRRLSEDPAVATEAIEQSTPSAELNAALAMSCARDGDQARAGELGAALVARKVDADRALLLRVTAGELASAVGLDAFTALEDDQIWTGASPRTRLAAIRRLAGKRQPWVLDALFERTRDRNYLVRWAAAQAIAASGPAAWAVLGERLTASVDTAVTRTDWNDPARSQHTHDVSVAGWILPSLAAALPGVGAVVEAFAGLVPRVPPGTEASLAQGFKLDALTNRRGAVPEAVWTLLDAADFWYSRVILIHAACLRAIADPQANPRTAARLERASAREGQHPLVVAAADLCLRALRSGDAERWVWDDEIAIMTRSGGTLDDRAARLVADIVLALNLTEQGDATDDDVREQRKEDIFRRPGLPYCLSHSRTRDEVFSGCHSACTFGLCPYPATADRALARGEFSEAFCRHQAEIAPRRRRVSPWTRLSGKDAARFWARMERRAS